MSGQFDTEFERVKQSCADLASQMQCPHHFTNAKVEMAGESFDDFSLEVITCCEEFRKHVEEALDALVTHRVSQQRKDEATTPFQAKHR
ncbi:MAG: hypothetical protein ACLPT4_05525 [Verrucomicrobiia bacterium]